MAEETSPSGRVCAKAAGTRARAATKRLLENMFVVSVWVVCGLCLGMRGKSDGGGAKKCEINSSKLHQRAGAP